MTVEELLQGLPMPWQAEGPGWDLPGRRQATVTGVRYDSRRIEPGQVFVCIKGFRDDGHRYVDEAVRRGAVLVVAESPVEMRAGPVPVARVANTRQALGWLAARWWGRPDQHLRLVGVTGTNGKTTTTYLVKAALEAGGHRVGLVGTIRHLVGNELLPAERTTPESADLHELLARMVAAGADAAVTEVSSHAVVLERLAGVEYDVGVFTNLTQDHLDFHGSMEAYRAAKARFFEMLGSRGKPQARKLAVLNADDPAWSVMAQHSTAPVLTFGLQAPAEVRAEEPALDAHGSRFVARTPWGSVRVELPLTGRFNVANALGALAVALHEGVGLDTAAAGLARVRQVDGRFEAVRLGQPFTVIVDYAHTPDGLDNVLRAATALAPAAIWVVFGCGGDRDRGKRPKMGAIAARGADHIIITSDNPRSEEPEAICGEVAAGVQEALGGPGGRAHHVEVVVDRREAITRALEQARPGDLVLIAGKGHETYQVFRDRVVPFDDREVARQVLRGLGFAGEEGAGS